MEVAIWFPEETLHRGCDLHRSETYRACLRQEVWQGILAAVLRNLQKNERIANFTQSFSEFGKDKPGYGVSPDSVGALVKGFDGLAGTNLDKLSKSCLSDILEHMAEAAFANVSGSEYIFKAVLTLKAGYDSDDTPPSIFILTKVSLVHELQQSLALVHAAVRIKGADGVQTENLMLAKDRLDIVATLQKCTDAVNVALKVQLLGISMKGKRNHRVDRSYTSNMYTYSCPHSSMTIRV